MKTQIAKGGAIVSALAFAFCWQIPLVLASFGLGSFGISFWYVQYRWVFLPLTFLLLGFAFYTTFKKPEKSGPWSKGFLYGTTVVTLGLVVYSLLVN